MTTIDPSPSAPKGEAECPECSGEMMTEVYPDDTEELKCPYCELQKALAKVRALTAENERLTQHLRAESKAREGREALLKENERLNAILASHGESIFERATRVDEMRARIATLEAELYARVVGPSDPTAITAYDKAFADRESLEAALEARDRRIAALEAENERLKAPHAT